MNEFQDIRFPNSNNPADSLVNMMDNSMKEGEDSITIKNDTKIQLENEESQREKTKKEQLSKFHSSLFLSVVWKVVLACLLISACFCLNFFYLLDFFKMINSIQKYITCLTIRRSYLNDNFIFIIGSIESSITDKRFSSNYNDLLNNEGLLQELLTSASSSFTNLGNFLTTSYSSKICTLFTKDQFEGSLKERICVSQLGSFYTKGLRNIIFRIFDFQNKYYSLIKASKLNKQVVYADKDFINLWLFEIFVIDPLMYEQFEEFLLDVNHFLVHSYLYSSLLLTAYFLIIIFSYLLIFRREMSHLKDEMMICKEIVLLIPAECTASNPKLYSFYIHDESNTFKSKASPH